ncbi:MAG TPA: hypothetical protein VLX08_09870 [Steroidobacteraceae bacterium]|nr:hypothetical protein [Steroidobacteraceae bacterium]
MYPDLDPHPLHARLLRELPGEAAQPYGFAEFERRSRERACAARCTVPAGAFLAVVIAAGVLALALRFAAPAPQGPARPVGVEAAGPAWLGPAGAGAAAGTEVMEQWLATLPREPAVVHVGTRAAVAGLEDRIAQVDDLLSVARVEQARPARLAALQQERTRLVGTLLQVRYAETLVDESR